VHCQAQKTVLDHFAFRPFPALALHASCQLLGLLSPCLWLADSTSHESAVTLLQTSQILLACSSKYHLLLLLLLFFLFFWFVFAFEVMFS
jgi:hypothetical protein